MRRNCSEIILKIIKVIPEERTQFTRDLMWNYNDSLFKAPEDTLQWERTHSTLIRHIESPKQEWEFNVWAIFVNKTIEEIRKVVTSNK